jgi:hypothetical protein
MNNETTVWFPEPIKEDNTFLMHDEGVFSWLNRSTTDRARACRRFLNENIAKVPVEWQPKLYRDLKNRVWFDTFFELIVARSLQILGASIQVEVPIEGTDSRPDFVAQFPDGTVIVEATVVKSNEMIRQHTERNEDLVRIIESLTPDGWSVAVWRLPKIGPNDSKKHFKRALKEIFDSLSLETTKGTLEIFRELDCGEIFLRLIPGRKGDRAAVVRGMASGVDDTEIKIRKKVELKKKQVRKAPLPVLLALGTQPLMGDLDDFDMALFGRTFERLGYFRETVEIGFQADGLFAEKRAEAPVYAGALAFTSIGWRIVPDPILYLHSRFSGKLPEALTTLERRSYQEGAGINIAPARIKNIIQGMNFVPGNV